MNETDETISNITETNEQAPQQVKAAPDDRPHRGLSPVFKLRLILCLAAAAAAAALKFFGGSACETVRALYEEYSVRSLMIESSDANSSFIGAASNDYLGG